MIKKISRTQAIERKLARSKKTSYLDKPAHMRAILAMNDEMADVRKDYKVKERKSQISAANKVLTA
jgi:hypothetical protein